VAVEVLAGPVVAHRRPRVGVARGDLHVAQADAGVEHGRDERVSEHVRVHPRHPDASGGGQLLEPSGRGGLYVTNRGRRLLIRGVNRVSQTTPQWSSSLSR